MPCNPADTCIVTLGHGVGYSVCVWSAVQTRQEVCVRRPSAASRRPGGALGGGREDTLCVRQAQPGTGIRTGVSWLSLTLPPLDFIEKHI